MAIVQEEEIREVVDENTGLIRQVQTTRIGLHDGEGGLYVAEQTRDVSARVMEREPPPRAPPRPQPARRAPAPRRRAPYVRPLSPEGRAQKAFRFCLIPFFIPCVCNKFWFGGLLLVLLPLTIILSIAIGFLPSVDCGYYITYTSISVLCMLGIILILTALCTCFICVKEDEMADYRDTRHRNCQTRIFFASCYFGLAFLLFLSMSSAFIFIEYHKFDVFGDCSSSVLLLISLYFSYALMLYFIFGWCFVACKESRPLFEE
ncbi:PREDICTED: uncharacterized protein LOC109586361 isoform X2 [Amphimedon queenslandica]|uniref:Uncharacterized protein n=1 Tax=Amphimedon queenslandica TaxID=400682 RepID=A0A1X7TRY1_AMPQE|nr:PREDICTED: uncharacterized protein LOC109586361 isoform X2 [Amphimedon queenslandica]|eukprot:XP_019858107.1 PREDICTED: uncharacterized protein LOC109586361 isoform X2 [Amphimedon queenslandica]